MLGSEAGVVTGGVAACSGLAGVAGLGSSVTVGASFAAAETGGRAVGRATGLDGVICCIGGVGSTLGSGFGGVGVGGSGAAGCAGWIKVAKTSAGGLAATSSGLL